MAPERFTQGALELLADEDEGGPRDELGAALAEQSHRSRDDAFLAADFLPPP